MLSIEAQLSQRDHACFVSLNISLSHLGSFKVIRSDIPEYGVVSVSIPHVCMSYRF